MNFATVKSITIPEGKVVKISRGEVVLWKVEEEQETIVNLIDTVGYTDGNRLRTSNGGLYAESGYTTTGMIPLEAVGDVYRTSGVNFKDVNWLAGIWIYRNDQSYWTYINTTASKTYDCKFGTAMVDADGNLTITVTAVDDGKRYFRICGIGSGANLIVTKNQPIE